MSRPYTQEETLALFIRHVNVIVRYWASLPDPKDGIPRTSLERCEGVAHSILTLLDGCSMELPRFRVSPSPHPDDKEFHISNKKNYFTEDVDISGSLHDMLYNGDWIRKTLKNIEE